MKLPLKFKLLVSIFEQGETDLTNLMKELVKEYSGEIQCNRSVISTHLLAMKAVGMIEVSAVGLTEDNQLIEKYRISQYGRDKLRYIK